MLERAGGLPSRRREHHQPVTSLLDRREAGELQQRDRVAPVMQPAPGEYAHAGAHPAHPVADAELLHEVERRLVRLADEVVVAFERKAAEVEMRRHSSGDLVGLVDDDPMAGLERVVSGRKTHHAGADYCDTLHLGLQEALSGVAITSFPAMSTLAATVSGKRPGKYSAYGRNS